MCDTEKFVNPVGIKQWESLSVFLYVCNVELCFYDFFQCMVCVCVGIVFIHVYFVALYRADFISNQHSYPMYENIEWFLVGKPQLPSSNTLGCPSPSPGTQPDSTLDCDWIV